MLRILMLVLLAAVFFSFAPKAHAVGYVSVELPIDKLPQEQPDQRTLRAFLAGISAADLTIPITPFKATPPVDDEACYRMWLLAQYMPDISAILLPPDPFTLASIETQPSLKLPTTPNQSLLLTWLANWDHPGNPYFNSKAVRLRAVMLAACDLMMLDYLYEHDPRGADRSDYLGGNLVWIGYTYRGAKNLLPAEVQAAFEAGLKRHVMRLKKWGPTGSMTDMDLFASVGLTFISQSVADSEIHSTAADYIKNLYTNPLYFNDAGYFVDNHCFDTSYNGISLFFAAWCAALTPDNPARDAIKKAYFLRQHLCFPAPDGSSSGPSHMSARCSSDPPREQWQFAPKNIGTGMLTDDAIHITKLPTVDEIRKAPDAVIDQFNAALQRPRKLEPIKWSETHWSHGLNFAWEFCPPGYYQKRVKMEAEKSPLNKSLYERDERFVREFNKAFVIARFDSYAVAIHTGEIGGINNYWGRPLGMGGGQISAFWQPETGATLLGRRRGIQGRTWDSWDEWRTWPIHAASGVTPSGELVTSSRIRKPKVEFEKDFFGDGGTVKVKGVLRKHSDSPSREVDTTIRYERSFRLKGKGVKVKTELENKQKEEIVEMYETIPVLIGELGDQKATTIEFRVGETWTQAAPEPTENVAAVKVTRFNGSTMIKFAQPVRAKISPVLWEDGYQTTARCRTILVDLLGKDKKLPAETSIEYTISAGK